MKFFVLALLAATACASRFSSEDEMWAHAVANRHSMPEDVQRNFTMENLRRWFSVASVEVLTPEGNASEVNIDPAVIWQIGEKIWQVIADNTPVVNATLAYGGAVPQGVSDWTQLAGWKDTQTQLYTFQFKNGLGMLLTQYQWVFSWKYGANYQGKGQYVTEAGPVTKKIYAYLTEHVDVGSSAFNAINYGTADAPVGGLDVEVQMKSHGYFESTTVSCHITVRGDGTSKIVTCDQN